MSEIPEEEWDRLEAYANAKVRFWICLNREHKNVVWVGDVAGCPECGLTSEMTQSYRERVTQHELLKMRRRLQDLTRDSESVKKFIDRHPRLHGGASVADVLRSILDEIGGDEQ